MTKSQGNCGPTRSGASLKLNYVSLSGKQAEDLDKQDLLECACVALGVLGGGFLPLFSYLHQSHLSLMSWT